MKDEPAFPFEQVDGSGVHFGTVSGLTKREYFAGLAMQPILQIWGSKFNLEGSDKVVQDCAIQSVKLADALIVELAKPGGE